MENNSPILVAGIERSGSSLIARIINICGGEVGEVNNRYENKAVKQLISNYLDMEGVDVDKQFPIPLYQQHLHIPSNWKKEVEGCFPVSDKCKPWVIKSNRLCQMYPVWNAHYPNAKWIIVRRRTGDIINSCLQTAYMHSYAKEDVQKQIGVTNERDGWLWWVRQHERMFVEMLEKGLNCKVVWPERMATGDYEQINEMLEWLGLPWSERIIKEIDPLLNKSRK